MRTAVTGASGRIGAHVTRLLAADPAHQVVAISRRPPPAARWPANVSWTVADYADPGALGSALRNIDTLVFISSDGPVAQVLVHHHNVIRAAAAGGAGHIVALSGLDADLRSPFCYAVSYGYTEGLLSDSGCPVSIARASIYTEFFAAFLLAARATGELRIPAGAGQVSLVSRLDVARCLAALAATGPAARHHDITGPEALSMAAIAGIAEREWQLPVRYVDTPSAEFCTELALAGEDPWWVYAFASMFASVREQRWSATSDSVAQLTGSPPLAVGDVLPR
jgi:NAD(P)H dehydrogenase (quinone)